MHFHINHFIGEKKEPEKKEMKFYDKNKSFFDNISCPLYAHLSRYGRVDKFGFFRFNEL